MGTALVCAALLSAGPLVADVIRVAEMAPAGTAEHGTVLRDRSNVRARPDMNAEVVAQLNKGDSVDVIERKSAPGKEKPMDWLRITLPADAKCYVSAKFLKDGSVTGHSVNVRCGPGTNFRDIGKLSKGDFVEVIETKGEWTQIKPTPKCTGWIAAELIEVQAATPAPPPSTQIEVDMPPVAVGTAPEPSAPEIRIVDADPETRVQYVVKVGVLHAVENSASAPGSYELMTPEVERRSYRMAYLEAPEINLSRFEGKDVRVFGTERWREKERFPVIAVDRVDMIW